MKHLQPNDATDPEFGRNLREAAANGVTILAVECEITEDRMEITKQIPVVFPEI